MFQEDYFKNVQKCKSVSYGITAPDTLWKKSIGK